MFTQKDFEGIKCPTCGGTIKYSYWTARCENDDWMCEDTELMDMVDPNYQNILDAQRDLDFPSCPLCGSRVTNCFTKAKCTTCKWRASENYEKNNDKTDY